MQLRWPHELHQLKEHILHRHTELIITSEEGTDRLLWIPKDLHSQRRRICTSRRGCWQAYIHFTLRKDLRGHGRSQAFTEPTELFCGVVQCLECRQGGFAAKQGLGRMKHIQCRFPWVQQEVCASRLKLRAIKTECNTADLLTKGLNAGRLRYPMELLGCQRRTSWSKLHRTEYFKSIDPSAPMMRGALAIDGRKSFDDEEADGAEDS